MAILFNDDFETLQAKASIKVRVNPESKWTNNLFYFGLVIEALAIIYTVGFSLNISAEKDTEVHLYQNIDWGQRIVYLLALLSLLIHQTYIRNNINAVNELTTKEWSKTYKLKSDVNNTSNYNYDFFPANLLFSWGEYWLRTVYFILLAVIAGEIPYFLIVIEKILNHTNVVHIFGQDSFMYSFSTYFFIISCSVLCLIVLLWDFLLLTAFNRLVKNNNMLPETEQKEIPFSSLKIKYFIISDILSLALWGCILLFIFTKNEKFVTTWLLALSLTYSIVILLLRSWIKKGINIKQN
jgi:hypothetical protein